MVHTRHSKDSTAAVCDISVTSNGDDVHIGINGNGHSNIAGIYIQLHYLIMLKNIRLKVVENL